MVANDRFGSFEIARGADGQPIELPRSRDEFVFLAFDVVIRRLVELHVIKSADHLRLSEKNAVMDRATKAMALAKPSFVRILEVGEDGDVPFYSSGLNDGEFLEDYITRRGALPPATTFSLMLQVLNDVVALKSDISLLGGLTLANPQMTLMEDTFLQLRIVDLGLSRHGADSASSEDHQRRLVVEACEVMFLMLTGKSFGGDDCDRYPVLTGLPSGLRAVLRSSLMNADNAPSSMERLRDDVREALSALVRDVGARSSRRHLLATDSLLPKSTLREVLLHDIPLDQLLKGRLVIEGDEDQKRYPFTLLATDCKTQTPVAVHLLPPRRIVQSEHYDAVPLQMWRVNAEKHPNILRSLTVWESPDMTFLTEERTPGLPLSRLIAERLYLNPPEVLIILRQVKKGLEQASECGVDRIDLHPSNIGLRLGGAPQAREMEKLLQKRIDAWPKFHVMLRPHMTMRSLYEPMLVDHSEGQLTHGKDFRNRSYVALAAYLLSGEKQTPGALHLPDSVSVELTNYIGVCLDCARQPGKTPSVQDFLAELEKLTSVPEVEQEGGGLALPPSRITERVTVSAPGPPVEYESVGAVSDFDEDQPEEYELASFKPRAGNFKPLTVPTIKEKKPAPSGRTGMIIWAAVFAVLILLALSMFPSPKMAEKKVELPKPTSPAVLSPKQATSSSTPAVKPQEDPAPPPPLTPEEIRRALMPSDQERNAVKTNQSSSTETEHSSGVSQAGPPELSFGQSWAAESPEMRASSGLPFLIQAVSLWTCSQSCATS